MIKINFEDNAIIAIDKPSGITVNKADTTKGELTIQDWAEEKLHIENGKPRLHTDNWQNEEQYSDFYNRGGIVHRLDKETSGVLLIGKNPEAFINLQQQFKQRVIKKTYLTLAHGKVKPETGEINVPIGRLPWNRRQFGVVAGGRDSLTRYAVKEIKFYKTFKEFLSFVEVYPETGRTHQIRVHLKYLGYPIFADFLYAGRKTQRNDRKYLQRVFLHASRISFLHPESNKFLHLESVLPEELSQILKYE